MAQTVKLPQGAEKSIVAKIKRHLLQAPIYDSVKKAATGFDDHTTAPFIEGGEIFRVFVLGIDEIELFKENGGKLSELARPTGRLHYQIKFADGSRGHAQVERTGEEDQDWSLLELFISPLAEKIDQAISLADELVTDNRNANLLLVPAYQVTAIGFWGSPNTDPNKNSAQDVIVVSASISNSRLKTGQYLTADSFLNALAAGNIVSGLTPSLKDQNEINISTQPEGGTMTEENKVKEEGRGATQASEVLKGLRIDPQGEFLLVLRAVLVEKDGIEDKDLVIGGPGAGNGGVFGGKGAFTFSIPVSKL